jgi:hypothetical protein
MRRMRRAVELGLPVVGVILVLAAVLFLARSLMLQLGVVLFGLILIEAGIWNLASPVLPSERKFVALRREVDGFILLVRRLNKATLALASEPTPNNRARLLEVRDEMLESVKRMELAAGRTEEDPPGPSSASGRNQER